MLCTAVHCWYDEHRAFALLNAQSSACLHSNRTIYPEKSPQLIYHQFLKVERETRALSCLLASSKLIPPIAIYFFGYFVNAQKEISYWLLMTSEASSGKAILLTISSEPNSHPSAICIQRQMRIDIIFWWSVWIFGTRVYCKIRHIIQQILYWTDSLRGSWNPCNRPREDFTRDTIMCCL